MRQMILVSFSLLALSLVGCSSTGGSIHFRSTERDATFVGEFNQAYVGIGKSGEVDIVLVDNAADWHYKAPKRNQPIQPTPLAPLRQVMHIHLYWRPLTGTTNNPAAINASIDWYVLGPDGSNEMIVYEGAGYVQVSGGGENRTVVIRDGQITPKSRTGQIQDPIGPARLEGVVGARRNEGRVQDTIAQIRPQMAAEDLRR